MRIGLFILALSLLGTGCGPKPVLQGDSLELDIDLAVCVYPEGFAPDYTMGQFQAARQGRGYFRTIKRIGTLNDAAGCDLIIDLNETGSTTLSPIIADIYSAYSRKKIFDFRARGRNQGGKVGEAVYQAFKPGSIRYAQLKAEAGQPVQMPAAMPSAPAMPSVDQPAYHLTERPDDFAVVVGIEKYSNDLPDAQFAERDAAAVKAHLLALGVPERNIKSLTGQRATLSGLASYLQDWLPRNVKDDSRVFFYFSGHGAPDPESGQAFLVPSDGNANFLKTTGYPVKKLYANLNALKAKQVIVALDSCFSGAGGRSVLAKGSRPLVNKVDTSIGSEGKIVLFTAASANEITSSLDDQGHGIFTYYFLRGLGGAAQGADGAITARGLYDYLKPKVQDAAARQNRDQTPVLEGAVDGELAHF
ncbi:MAG: caspase family protein [Elusimicrobia bacterium]|nr:caspase family protein [Elusimicrobiota bacterium]